MKISTVILAAFVGIAASTALETRIDHEHLAEVLKGTVRSLSLLPSYK